MFFVSNRVGVHVSPFFCKIFWFLDSDKVRLIFGFFSYDRVEPELWGVWQVRVSPLLYQAVGG